MPTSVLPDDDEQIIADLQKDVRRLRSRLATTSPRGGHDAWTAAASPATTYQLSTIPVLGTCEFAINGHEQREGTDFTVDLSTGIVTVLASLSSGDLLVARYLVTDWLVARSLPPEQGLTLFSVGGFADNANYDDDIDTNTWATKTALPNSPAARHQFAIGTISGKVYVTGGTTSGSGTYVYDPVSDTWTALTAAPTVVSGAGYAVLSGKLYVIGGTTSTGTTVATVQVYDPATDSWSTVTSLPTARASGMAAGVIGGKIYIAGGTLTGATAPTNTCYVYDPGPNTWTAKATMTTAVDHVAGAAVAGKLYVVGGRSQFFGGTTVISTVQVYDPGPDSWSTVTAYPLGASSQHAATEAGGALYVSGGTTSDTGTGASVRLYVFDPGTGNWTRLADMASTKYGHGMASA